MADTSRPDMSCEFTCFMCNGKIVQLGSIVLLPQGVKLCTALGWVDASCSELWASCRSVLV